MQAKRASQDDADNSITQVLDDILALDLNNAAVSVLLGSILEDDSLPELQIVQVTDELANKFRTASQKEIEAITKNRESGDLQLRRYSAGSKPDRHEIEFLSVTDYPHVAEQLLPLQSLADVKIFQMENEFIKGLRFYVIVASPRDGIPLYCFRSYSAKKELSRSTKFAALMADGQFDTVRDPVFLFDQNLDALAYGENILVLNQDQFQKIFRFFELVVKTAKETLRTIKKNIPISNFADFEAARMGHLQKLTKLRNISQKTYLKGISINDLKKVIKRYNLKIDTEKIGDKEMLVFDPRDRWAILRLLDDDYLESLLTKQKYEVTGKRPHD